MTGVKEKKIHREIRRYQAKDKKGVLELIDAVWGESSGEHHKNAWDWKFRDESLLKEAPDCGPVVVEQDGKILAYSGGFPFRLKLGQNELWGSFCQDTLSSPDHRGVGIRLIKYQLAESPLLVGSAIERAMKLWDKLGRGDSVKIGPVKKLILFIDPSSQLIKRKVPKFISVLLKPLIGTFLKILSKIYAGSMRLITIERVKTFPKEINDLCHAFSKDHEIINLRSKKYLDWRFVDVPLNYEKVLLRQGGELKAYMVYRFVEINNRKVLLILEMLAIENKEKYYSQLLKEILKEALEHNVSDVQTLVSGCECFRKVLKKHFFLEKTEENLYIANIRNDICEMSSLDIYDINNWFITAGDNDYEFIFFQQKL